MMDDYKEMLDEAPPPRPAFLKRFWMVFVQPGELFRALGKNPAWFPMALFVGVVMGVSVAALPAEMWEAQMGGAGTGESFPQEALLLIRGAVALASSAALVLMTLVVSSVTYVVFVFMRGDNVVFKQHLAVVSHAGIVLLVGALVHLPLQIRSGDLEQSLSIGTFFPFLSDGFLLNFFNQLQLFRPLDDRGRGHRAGGTRRKAQRGLDDCGAAGDAGDPGPGVRRGRDRVLSHLLG